MPYVVCPICKAPYHLNVRGDPRAWEAEHVTDRTEDGTPLLTCIRCWAELEPRHKVTLRVARGDLLVGSEGIVLSSKDGTFVVSFGAAQAELARSDLFYIVGQQSPDAA